jgi:hypothetical protein
MWHLLNPLDHGVFYVFLFVRHIYQVQYSYVIQRQSHSTVSTTNFSSFNIRICNEAGRIQ